MRIRHGLSSRVMWWCFCIRGWRDMCRLWMTSSGQYRSVWLWILIRGGEVYKMSVLRAIYRLTKCSRSLQTKSRPFTIVHAHQKIIQDWNLWVRNLIKKGVELSRKVRFCLKSTRRKTQPKMIRRQVVQYEVTKINLYCDFYVMDWIKLLSWKKRRLKY